MSFLKGIFSRLTLTSVKPAAMQVERLASSTEQSYSTDQAIASAKEDRFARAPFALRVAETIAHRRDTTSLVVGIHAPWGDGKTSVLNMIQERLNDESDVVVVKFNPWHFTSEEQLIRGFFATLGDAIGKELRTRGEKFGEAMTKYGGLLSLASASFGGGVVSVNPGAAARDFGETLSTTALDDLKGRIEKELSDSGKRVVVLIDDIDRLDRAETHAIFKLVKLSAGFQYTTYLLAFDPDVVAAALGERYGQGGYDAGRAFLEKIIQVPLHLPPADPAALRSIAYEGINQSLVGARTELSRADLDAFSVQFASGIEVKLSTPRQTRLYANALLFAVPLVDGEVNLVDFMLLEGLRVFYPKLYSAIRSDPAPWVNEPRGHREDAQGRVAKIIDIATPELSEGERALLTRGLLKHLFPRISGSYGSDWEAEWQRSKRVCSQAYFRRYFAYGVPPDDVSDLAIDDLVSVSASISTEALQEKLHALLLVGTRTAVRKLRQKESSLSSSQALALINAIAPMGDNFIAERGLFEMGGTRAQAAILMAQSLRSVPDAQLRADAARNLISRAIPLPFAVECLSWLRPSRDEGDANRVVPGTLFDELESILAARIQDADDAQPLYRQFGADARALYWVWDKADPAFVRDRLRTQLTDNSDEVDSFLTIHVGEAWGMEDGLPRPSDFRRETYDDIASRVDPASIMETLRARYGSELDQPVFHHSPETSLPRRIAHQFALIHQAVLEEGLGDVGGG